MNQTAENFRDAARSSLNHTERVFNVDAMLAYSKPEAQRWIWRRAAREQMAAPMDRSFLQCLEAAIAEYLDAHRGSAHEHRFISTPRTDLRSDR